MTSHVDGTTVSYTNSSLMLTFSSLTCHDDGQYTCIVIKEDDSQIESHVYLQVKIKSAYFKKKIDNGKFHLSRKYCNDVPHDIVL